MPASHPDSLHQALRQALSAGDFDAAGQLSDAFGSAIYQELADAPPTLLSALFSQRLAMLQENLSLGQVLRAHLANQLQTNTAVCLYQDHSANSNSWTFDA